MTDVGGVTGRRARAPVYGGGILILGALIVTIVLLRQEPSFSAEHRYEGVHMCASKQEKSALGYVHTAGAFLAQAGPTATPDRPAQQPLGGAGDAPPFFAQVSKNWGALPYDSGLQQGLHCGSTIAQCGCAMTSVATVLTLFNMITTPDGADLSPQTLNSWFSRGARLTKGGWVSEGYAYGGVVWTAVNSYSKDVAAAYPGTPKVRFNGWGLGSTKEINAQLSKHRAVVLGVPGHFISAVGRKSGTILINDPYYRDRTTLSAYAGKVEGSRMYEPSDDLSGIMVSAPSSSRIRVTDSAGHATGTLAAGAPDIAANKAAHEIPGSTYRFDRAWRDPTCTERPPPPDAGVNSVFIRQPPAGDWIIEISDPSGGDTSLAIHTYDKDGNVTINTSDGGPSNKVSLEFNPASNVVSLSPVSVIPKLNFVDESAIRLPLIPTSSHDAAVIDIDHDGDLDVVLANGRGPLGGPIKPEQNRVLVNDGHGLFKDETATRMPALADPSVSILPSDFTGDGNPDLFVSNSGAPNRLLVNDGKGHFTESALPSLPGVLGTIGAVAGDVDGDGDADILLSVRASVGSSVRLLMNIGGSFTNESDHLPKDQPYEAQIAVADLDGDRDVDVAVAGAGWVPRLWLNAGGTFSDASSGRLDAPAMDAARIILSDVDRDRDVDLIVGDGFGASRLYLNSGHGSFVLGSLALGALSDLALGDADANGFPDLLEVGSLRLFSNRGRGRFVDAGPNVLPPVLGALGTPHWADVDGDGDLDILVTRFDGRIPVLLINRTVKLAVGRSPSPSPTPSAKVTLSPSASPKPACKVISGAQLTANNTGTTGHNVVTVTWKVSGGCAPYTGKITATREGASSPYATYSIAKPSGSLVDDPAESCAPPKVHYALTMTDGGGHKTTATASVDLYLHC